MPLVIGVNGPAHLTKGDAAEFAALINDRMRAIQAGRAGERRMA